MEKHKPTYVERMENNIQQAKENITKLEKELPDVIKQEEDIRKEYYALQEKLMKASAKRVETECEIKDLKNNIAFWEENIKEELEATEQTEDKQDIESTGEKQSEKQTNSDKEKAYYYVTLLDNNDNCLEDFVVIADEKIPAFENNDIETVSMVLQGYLKDLYDNTHSYIKIESLTEDEYMKDYVEEVNNDEIEWLFLNDPAMIQKFNEYKEQKYQMEHWFPNLCEWWEQNGESLDEVQHCVDHDAAIYFGNTNNKLSFGFYDCDGCYGIGCGWTGYVNNNGNMFYSKMPFGRFLYEQIKDYIDTVGDRTPMPEWEDIIKENPNPKYDYRKFSDDKYYENEKF